MSAEREVGVDELQPDRRVERRRLLHERDLLHVADRNARVEAAGLETASGIGAGRIRLCRHHGRHDGRRQQQDEATHLVHRYTLRGWGRRAFHRGGSCDSRRLMMPISAVCAVTTSLAKTLASTSWPAPGDLSRSSTILIAPAWCLIMPVRKSRSKATPFASLIASSSSSESMPSIRMSCQDEVSGTNCP